MDAEHLIYKLEAQTGDFTSSMAKASESVEKYEKNTQKADKSGGGLFSGMLGGVAKIGLAATGIGALTQGVAGLASGLVSGNAEFETYQTQFGVLLGNADKAKTRLSDLAKFGATTPFELPELVRADKVLTSFGLDSETTKDKFKVSAEQIRTTIGDVAAGTGASFEELAGTFGKFASGATGDAIARFQEMGIATKEEMAQWGLEFSKSGQLLTPAKEAFTVLEAHVRGKFGGMMDAQSKTFEGMASNLQDWIGQTGRTLAAPIFDKLKDGLQGLMGFLSSPDVQTNITTFATMLADGIGKAATFVGDVIRAVGPSIKELFDTLGPIVQTVSTYFQQFFATIQAGEDPLQAFGDLASNIWNIIVDLGTKVFNAVSAALPGILAKLGEWGGAFIAWIGPKIPPMLVELGKIALAIGKWILTVAAPAIIRQLIEWGNAFLGWIGSAVLPELGKELGKVWDAITTWIGKTASDIWTKIQDVGKGIVTGIQQGIKNAWDGLMTWLRNLVVNTLPQFVKDFLGIKSPSEVFAKIGEMIPAGLALGISRGVQNVQSALGGMLGDTSVAGSVSFGAGRLTSAANGLFGPGASPGGSRDVHIYIDSREISYALSDRSRLVV